jgi:3-isopropylmalate/(R)-2-methylmalate dehydratase small subunit
MIIKGKVHKFGDDINTDDIIAAKYLVTTNPVELGKKCMQTIAPDFAARVKKGDIIVAGRNFGCGSSREHAPVAIKGLGISCVIAKSFARIFFRNAINIGLPIVEMDTDKIKDGDELEIDLAAKGLPEFMQEIINAGGLMEWIKKSSKG